MTEGALAVALAVAFAVAAAVADRCAHQDHSQADQA